MCTHIIQDDIYGQIHVSPMAIKLINTLEFQRLKNIKQLGICHYVFPKAIHTRYEHSIGVYHLTAQVTNKLKNDYPTKIFDIPYIGKSKLTDLICECINIAGCLHDIGHLCFSHLFDDIMKQLSISKFDSHETRSCILVDLICGRELNMSEEYINFIKSLINPTSKCTGALYQIVSNNLNGLDVDKLDYLIRDVFVLNHNTLNTFNVNKIIQGIVISENCNNDSNEICGNLAYSEDCYTDICNVFKLRMEMHRLYYNNKVCKIIELMICDLFRMLDSVFDFINILDNLNIFCELNDKTIFDLIYNLLSTSTTTSSFRYKKLNYAGTGSYFVCKKLNYEQMNIVGKAFILYCRIIDQRLYKSSKIVVEDIGDIQNFIGNENDLDIMTIHFKSILGNKDPFDHIYFHDNDNRIYLMKKQFFLEKLSENFRNEYFLTCKDEKQVSKL